MLERSERMRYKATMRYLLVLAFMCSLGAAELEQFTLTDGRRFVGYYDAEAGTATIEGPPRAVIKVKPSDILSRAPYVRPIDADPIKRDEAELTRLEAERAAAVADAVRLRQFAGTRSGMESDVAFAQAAERENQAASLVEKIDALRAKIDAARPPKPERQATAKAIEAERTAKLDRAMEEAERLRQQALDLEFQAVVSWIESQNLAPADVPKLSKDPRQSEIEAQQRAEQENARKERLSNILAKAKRAENNGEKMTVVRLFKEMGRDERVKEAREERDPKKRTPDDGKTSRERLRDEQNAKAR